ncbi:MAG TPA: hypothetical protein VIV27_01925 [Halioglobus sp.]
MDFFLVTLGLALPVLLGGLWLNPFVPKHNAGRTALVWGNGTLIGLLLIPQLMRAVDALAIPLTFVSAAFPVGALMALALIVHFARRKRAPPPHVAMPDYSAMPSAHKVLFLLLLLLIVLRVATLGLEVLWRPLFPWDATMHWANKARVWFEYQRIVPFVTREEWLELGGAGVFTDPHPDYPLTIPLLQVWMNLAVGRWDESLMNLPWLLCLFALGTAFYGQLRVSSVSPVIAVAFAYLLFSLPLLNIHVALAGYADIFLAATYCGALMAMHSWVATRQRWQAVLALCFAIACPLIKGEGLVWSLTLVPALALRVMSRREAAKLYLLFALLLLLLFLVAPADLMIAGHHLGNLTPEFHPEGLSGMVQSVWLHDNWHLLGYLALAVLPLGLILLPGALTRTYLEITVTLGVAVSAFLFLFLFTGFGAAAADFTGVGRLSIHLAPGLLFLVALLCNDLLSLDSGRPAQGTATPA